MQGSLDHSPAVIRQDRLKLAALFLLFAGGTAALVIGTWISSYLKDAVWAYLGTTFLAPLALGCTVAALASGWSLFHPATLTIDAGGLTYRAYWYERRYRWSDIAAFMTFSASNRFPMPACSFVGSIGGRRHAAFGRAWEMEADAIVELLNAAMAKWSAPEAGGE